MKSYYTWLLASAALLYPTAALSVDKRAALDDCLASRNVPVYSKNTANYTQAVKPFNLRLPFTPASYAVPVTVKHVQDAVSCGAANGIRVSAKCGGHSYASFGLGGEDGHLVVDMRRFNIVTVDAAAHTAVVGAGGRLGNIALALYSQGKQALSHGTCPGVGISGLTLGGGYGLSSRLHGLTLDNLLSATVVLANSTVVTASESQNPDLFWGLRGGSGSLGIVTDFKFKTFTPSEEIINFSYNMPVQNTTQLVNLLTVLQDFTIHNQPPELNMRTFFPRQLTGTYYGSRASFDALMNPLLSKLNVSTTGKDATISTKGWIDTLTAFAFSPLQQPEIYDNHETFFAKSLMTPALSPEALYALADYYFTTARNIQGRGWYLLIDMHGGAGSAVTSVPVDATAYPHRDKLFKMQFYDTVMGNGAYQSSWFSFLNGWVSAIVKASPKEQFGMYVNYADPSLSKDEAHQRYWGVNYQRLLKVKSMYDPKKVFEGPQLAGS